MAALRAEHAEEMRSQQAAHAAARCTTVTLQAHPFTPLYYRFYQLLCLWHPALREVLQYNLYYTGGSDWPVRASVPVSQSSVCRRRWWWDRRAVASDRDGPTENGGVSMLQVTPGRPRLQATAPSGIPPCL